MITTNSQTYNTLIRPRLEYACVVREAYTKKDINKQNKFRGWPSGSYAIVIVDRTLPLA